MDLTYDQPIERLTVDRYLITTLAEYQTSFWREVGAQMRSEGHDVYFLSFDSRSVDLLADYDLPCFDATASQQKNKLGERDPLVICEQFDIREPLHWLTHEKYAFGVRDSEALLTKLAGVLVATDEVLEQLTDGGEVKLVQELGGFLSVLGSHFAAKARGLESWFIEPSFFRSRLLFIEGSIAALQHGGTERAPVSSEVKDYLDNTIDKNLIVVPEKDRHQYTTAFRKVVTVKNAKRLVEKAFDKYFLRKEQEFGHIGGHVSTHLKMIGASRKLAKHYSSINEAAPFVYYPLHVPGDVALTLRSPEYLDQIALVDFLCRNVPMGFKVAVKEHPAMIGAIGTEQIFRLTRRYDNFALIPPATNNFDVLRKASAVVTVNSKSGAEAGLLGKEVLVLGDAFYRDAPFAQSVESLSDLRGMLADTIARGGKADVVQETSEYYAAMWEKTWPGELYVESGSNPGVVARSLVGALQNGPLRARRAA